MAYALKNPTLRSCSIGNNAPAEWYGESADAGATVDTSGFISDAVDLGMKVGDTYKHRDTSTDIVTSHVVKVLNANGSADLTDATTYASGTNTD